MKYIHTNITGTFVFDNNFKLIEKIPLKDTNIDFLDWLDSEKRLVKKYKKLIYIGFKKQDIKDIEITQDLKKLARLSEFFKKNIKEFFRPNLELTKRAVKESVNEDLFIIHAINNIDELDKSANILVKRLREWYELYLPEFSRSIGDNESFTKLILSKDKKQLMKEVNITEQESMGAELGKQDLEPIMNLATKIKELYELRKLHEKYLEKVMKKYCPNLNALAGTMIGAKLLAVAGSLKRLVLFPASTIQVLGAEKALFRHMRTGARPPKYGLLINHPIVAKTKEKGKAARVLAHKIAICVKVDY
ncbi:hypothetical protein KY328_03315 [Candidatus Woesearchaeota archaeon]|nr:hypothetical protein [Candidatus Woesearchaeota archaeon]